MEKKGNVTYKTANKKIMFSKGCFWTVTEKIS
jgi:peptide methionine sulfoxide reductase MsrA